MEQQNELTIAAEKKKKKIEKALEVTNKFLRNILLRYLMSNNNNHSDICLPALEGGG